MAIPILGRRQARRQAEIDAAIAKGVEDGIEKAMTPAVAAASQMASGATYQVNTSSPFNQVGPGAGFVPLPREDGVFNSGFGPANPLFPDAIDPLTPAGRTLARRTEYLISANVNLIDRRVPWSVLKGLAEDVDVIQRCIQIVQDAIVGLNWSWGFSPQILQQIMTEEGITNSSRAAAHARDKYGEELSRVQQFFLVPDKRMGFTFSQWLTDIIYSHLVYDGIVIAPEYNLGGELTSLSTIDTSTIKILLDNQGFIPRPPNPAYQQILYGFPRGEFQAENVQADGSIPNAYMSDQLAYYIRRPRPSSIYGYSQVEECINIATIYMERQAWLHAEYSHGVTPKMVVNVEGSESWTPEQLAYFERIYNDQFTGQTQRRQQFMLMRPGMKAEQLKSMDEAYKNTYDEWLIMQMGAKFGIPMSQLGIKGPASLGGGKEKGQSDQHETYATDALKNFLIECINDLARRFLGVGPELTMTATGGGSDDDDMTRAQADQIDVNAGIRTRNEVRAERGIPLMDEPEADQLGITIGTGVSFLAGQLANQQAAAQAAAQPKAGPSAPGTQSPGDEAGPSDADGPPRPGRPSGDAGAEGDRSAQAQSEAASTGDRPPVTAKDDQRQPDTEATKEIGAFLRFAKAKADRGAWRDFEFQHIDEATGRVLNHLGSTGDTAAIRHALAKADDNAQALIDWYESGADGQIEWGSEGDFDACVAIAGKYVDNPEGFCQLRHMGATGEPAGKAPGEGTKAAADSFTPPKGVQEEAQRAVEWIKDGHAGANFTAVGRGRAGDLAAGRAVSLDVVKRMASYLARHKVDEQGQGWSPGEDGYPSPGRVAWAAWGGDPAVSWTSSILASAEKAAGDVAFISPSGQVVMPQPLKTGDKIIVQHADATNDAYPVIDASTPNDTDDEYSVSDDTESNFGDEDVAKATELVMEMLAPELDRLRESYALLSTIPKG